MHESFFGLQKRPFLAVPTLDRYFPVAGQEQAIQACRRAIGRAEGPIAILGGTGLGKSMVCLRVADAFRRSFEVVLLSSSQICSRRALLQSLLFELRMPYRDLNEGELRLSLLDRLQPSNDYPTDGVLLIVDEAQSLSIKLLEELRMITNLTRDGQQRVRLVLCGTQRLDELLSHPQLESLNQRLAGRCYLSPLNAGETAAYITHKVELCGASIHGVMTDEAMRMVHRATDGVPRLIDQLCDQALRAAADINQRPCSAGTVEEAWAALQQLPLPWSDTGKPLEHATSTIEFGSLDEDGENEFSFNSFDSQATGGIESSLIQPIPSDSRPTSNLQPSLPKAVSSSAAASPAHFPLPESTSLPNSFSPIPSAGMGISGFTTIPSCLSLDIPSSPAVGGKDIWEGFLAAQRQDGKSLQLDFRRDNSPATTPFEPSDQLPETVDFPAPLAQTYSSVGSSAPLTHSYGRGTGGEGSLCSKVGSSSSISSDTRVPDSFVPTDEQLFGSDFEEELAIEPSRFGGASSTSNPLPEYSYEDLPLSSFATDDALAYEVEPFPSKLPTPATKESESQNYSELLDTLSSTNLEAMTFDPAVRLQTETEMDSAADEVTSRYDGGLSRPSRSSILSFADMQSERHLVMNDDRDLLVIEEDLPNKIAGLSNEIPTPAVVNPYKQLFSKLRG
jgi:type II secretory pathway predicted ATPase ExeA